jgi:SRSO17 transposase
LGKTANGQVVVTTRYVDPYYAWDVNGQLYLPAEKWCQDTERRRRAGIPADLTFQTKPAIALERIAEAKEAGVPFKIVVSDGSYGDNPTFLDGLDDIKDVFCVVAVACDFGVRLPEEVEAARQSHPGQPAPLHRADEVLATQSEEAWQAITWRMGTDGPLTKQFVALWVYRAVGETTGPEGWLFGERPLPGHEGKRKFYWSDLPVTTPLPRLAELSHRRPSVERGYQDGKGFTGLDAYAARKWDSFHRHLAIDMLVLSWLALQRPPVENPVIALEPQAVQSSNEPLFPYGPEPYRSIGPIRRKVCEFLLEELVRWLVSTGQVNVSIPPGRQRFQGSAQPTGPPT